MLGFHPIVAYSYHYILAYFHTCPPPPYRNWREKIVEKETLIPNLYSSNCNLLMKHCYDSNNSSINNGMGALGIFYWERFELFLEE